MTQSHPTDETFNEQRVQNLPFEIIAVAQNTTVYKPSNENIPLNFKIRIKSKKEPKIKQAIISVPKLNITQRTKNVRVVNSDQTIMSFNLFVDPHSDKILPKKREKFFFNIFKPGCLMQNDIDDVPYMPTASHNTSEMQNVYSNTINDWALNVTEKFALRKNITPASDRINSPKTFFGQSKAGGCLDPPFNEENYAYKPTSISPNTKQLNSDISNTSTENTIDKSLDDSLFNSIPQISKQNRDSVISDSLITYPQDISISKTEKYEESQNTSFEQISNNIRLQKDNEFTELYFMPPTKTNIKKKYEENQNKKYIDHKVSSETQDEITSSVVDISLLNLNEISMKEPELTNGNLLKNHKSNKQIIGESTTDKKESTIINNKLHTSHEHQCKKNDIISKTEAKEIIDNLIRTIIIIKKSEIEPLSTTIKEPSNKPVNNYNVKKEKNDMRELHEDIHSNRDEDISNTSKDLLVRNLKLGYEYDISTKKSNEVEKRKMMHSEKNNIDINQFSSSLDIGSNISETQVKLRDENATKVEIENAISKRVSPLTKKHLEKSKEENMMLTQNKNIEYVANNVIAKINKIEQSPKLSLRTMSNTEIISDIQLAEMLSITKDSQHSETPSATSAKDFNNNHSSRPTNIDKFDEYKKDIDGKPTAQDVYLDKNKTTKLITKSNKTENDINDVCSTATLKIRQNTVSELNTSIKSVHSRMTKSEEFKNIYNIFNEQKDQKETYTIEGDIVVQESSTQMSSLKLNEDTFSLLKKSNTSSSIKKTISDDLTKNKMLKRSIDENDKYYNVANDDINNRQSNDSSKGILLHQITKDKNVDLKKSVEINSGISDILTENKRLLEYRRKSLHTNISDISSLKVKGTDSTIFSQMLLKPKNTSRNSGELISNVSQHRQSRNSIKSESFINTNFKDHKALTDLAKKDITDLTIDQKPLYEHKLTNSAIITKQYISTSLHSLEASRRMLQDNIEAAQCEIFTIGRKSSIIKNDNPSSENFQSSERNADDFRTMINNNILLKNKKCVNNFAPARDISAKCSKLNVPPSIALNLNFHISNNYDKNIIFIKTFDPMLPPNKRLEDKFVSTKCVVIENDKEIKMPITSDINLTLAIKKKTSTRKILSQTNGIGKTFSEGNLNNNSLLHDKLNSVYNNLLPLKEIINDLRQKIKLLSQQQIHFKELLYKIETKSLRLIDVDQECKCKKHAITDMDIYYSQ